MECHTLETELATTGVQDKATEAQLFIKQQQLNQTAKQLQQEIQSLTSGQPTFNKELMTSLQQITKIHIYVFGLDSLSL